MSELKDAMKIVKNYGQRRYDEGYAQGYVDGVEEARKEVEGERKSIKDCINIAYNEGRCEAERAALKQERMLEADIDRLKETVEILRKSNIDMAKKIEGLQKTKTP